MYNQNTDCFGPINCYWLSLCCVYVCNHWIFIDKNIPVLQSLKTHDKKKLTITPQNNKSTPF